MNWISITLNVVGTHTHSRVHARPWGFHTWPPFSRRFLQRRPTLQPQGEGLCQRAGESTREGEESRRAVGVEVIMRHWSEPRRWRDETHELCLCSSLSRCLPLFISLLLLTGVLFRLVPFFYISGRPCLCLIFFFLSSFWLIFLSSPRFMVLVFCFRNSRLVLRLPRDNTPKNKCAVLLFLP